ncbi:MAG TPA: glycosyltransferase, partial [Candidatus Nanoarchaeia archaeon]|nr:glycosyltransferase [Candidatus Nanoarchaeia archaeon]
MKQKTRERTIAIAPCLNEEQAIGNVVRKLKPWVDTVVVVDDGSTDRTEMVARRAGAIVLKHKKN